VKGVNGLVEGKERAASAAGHAAGVSPLAAAVCSWVLFKDFSQANVTTSQLLKTCFFWLVVANTSKTLDKSTVNKPL